MSNKNKIQKLAEVTTDDLSSPPEETVLPENLFPPVARRVVANPTAPAPQQPSAGQQSRRPTDPAPQRPMLLQVEQEGPKNLPDPVDKWPDTPDLDETIRAMLV